MKIAFVSANSNWLSKAIAWFTKSKWSHVMLILDDTIDGDAVLVEASAKHGIILNLLSKYHDRTLELYQDKNDNWDINPIKQYIGNNYGYLQIIGNAIARIFKLKKNPFSSDEVCSELVLQWLLNTPYKDEFKHLDPNLASPEDLYKIIKNSSNFTRV